MPSRARRTFLTNLATYARAADQPILRRSSPALTPTDHSGRLMRNGLAVIGLAILEDFIRRRTSEVLSLGGESNLAWNQLPSRLRDAVTERAVANLAFQVRGLVRDQQDPMPVIQSTARALASTSRATLVPPAISLHWAASNIRAQHVAELLKDMGVESPWDQVTAVALRSGFAVGRLELAFETILRARHQAAHRADSDIVYLDVQGFRQSALAFAVGFDAMLTRAAFLWKGRDAGYLGGAKVTASDVKIRFLDDSGTGYAERLEGRLGRVAVHANAKIARQQASARARGVGEVVVQRNRLLQPTWWCSPDLP